MSETSKGSSGGGGGCGCLGCLVFLFLIWALIFGVTIGGHHYGISCDMEHGVLVAGNAL